MAASFGTSNISKPTSASPTITLTLTAGQSVVVAIQWDNAVTFNSIGSALGNTYTIVGSELSGFNTGRTRVYRAVNVTGGSETVTFNLSGSSYCVLVIGSSSGVSTTFNSGNGPVSDAASPWTGTNVTPGIADAIIWSVIVNDSTNTGAWTAGNGFTSPQNDADGSTSWPTALGYKVVASTTPDGGSWTATQGTNGRVWNVVFDGAGGGGGGPTITVVPSASAQRNRRSSGRFM